LRGVFLTARRQHSENFNEKLKLAGALNGAKKGTAAVLRQLVVAPYGHPPKLPRNTP
jgi:hypothetical protein